MKRIYLLAAVILSVVLSGCSEVENPERLLESEKKTALTERVDLSAIQVPEKICVYSASGWERKAEDAAEIFLGKGYKEAEADADGRRFLKDSGTGEEKLVLVHDGGRTYFGESGQGTESGLVFNGREEDYKICWDSGLEKIEEEYLRTGKLSVRKPDEKDDTFLQAERMVSGYLDQLGMEGYSLNAVALLDIKKQKDQKGCWMCWKQEVDGIPISDILLENEGKTVYNYRYSVTSPDLMAFDSSLKVLFVGKDLVRWNNCRVIKKGKQLGEYSAVPVREAYKKVQEHYPRETKNASPVLERAELQYELVKRDDRYYLYPVWVFGVHEKGGESEWMYYLIDAVTGDYFKDIPAGS